MSSLLILTLPCFGSVNLRSARLVLFISLLLFLLLFLSLFCHPALGFPTNVPLCLPTPLSCLSLPPAAIPSHTYHQSCVRRFQTRRELCPLAPPPPPWKRHQRLTAQRIINQRTTLYGRCAIGVTKRTSFRSNVRFLQSMLWQEPA